MDAISFKAALPADVQLLWNDIEQAAGLKIAIGEISPGVAPQGARMGCDVNRYPLVRLLRYQNDPVYPGAALHELLHLQRYIIDGIPCIRGLGEPYGFLAGYIENILEHLVIVPRQSAWNLREQERWNRMASQNWDTYQDNTYHPFTSRQWAMIAWLNTALCADTEIEHRATSTISQFDQHDSIYLFRNSVFHRLRDKRKLVKFVINNLGLPEDKFGLYEYKTDQHINFDGQRLNAYGDIC